MSVKVSICIPTYKQVAYLRKTLMSVLEQTFTDYEVIVTDDSPDDSVKLLVEEFDFKGRLLYYKNQTPLGSPENWNEAMRRSGGEYIKILHHDDYFTNEFSLTEYVYLLDKNPDTNFAFSSTVIIDANSGKMEVNYPQKQFLEEIKRNPENLLLRNRIGAPSATIFRRTKLEFDKNLKWLVDLEFYIRVLNHNKNFAFSLRPLIATVNNAGHQVTSESLNNAKVELYENLYVYNKLLLPFSDRRALKEYFALLFYRFGIKSKKDLETHGLQEYINLPAVNDPQVFSYRPEGFIKRRLIPEKISYL